MVVFRFSHITNLVISAIIILSIYLSTSASVFAVKTADDSYVEGELLVVFNSDINKNEAKEMVSDLGGESISMIEQEEDVTALVTLPEGQTVEKAAAAYIKEADITHAQPNYKYETVSELRTSTNDTNYSSLWHFEPVQVEKAWKLVDAVSHNKVKVAVLDTGLDVSHPDLQSNINRALSVDICSGTPIPITSDEDSHGTNVTGVIGATANNKLGVAGVGAGNDNSIVDVFAVDVFKDEGAYTSDIVAGINYASQHGAKVINMSLTMSPDYNPAKDPLLEQAINRSVQEGITVVCAAGNSGLGTPSYPSDFEDSIGVIATDEENKRWEDSNYGELKDISAPGVDIYSTYINSEYQYLSGTSMAAPMVSSAAAMLYSIAPDITVSEVKKILYDTATDIGPRGADIETASGILNAYKAINTMIPEKPANIKVKNKTLSWRIPGLVGKSQVEIFSGTKLVYDSGEIDKTTCKLPDLKPGKYTIKVTSISEKSGWKSQATSCPYRVMPGNKSNPSDPSDAGQSGGTDIQTPETGDNTNIETPALLFIISALAMIILARCASRENR